MPSPASRPWPGALVRRRTALGLLAVGAVAAGCTGQASPPQEARTSPARGTDPDVLLAATVLAAQQQVLDLVTATMRRHRQLRRALLPTATVHREHVRLLRNAVPSSAPSPSGAPAGAAPRVPSHPGKALAAIVHGEDRLNLVAKRSAFSAESGAFARILASMAAAAAQQSTLLRDRGSAGGGR